MPALTTSLRNQLERAIVQARDAAEAAASAALVTLAVWQDDAYAGLALGSRSLRVALRARARALGATETNPLPLVREVAYEGWHRMLFARFLAENGLLRHPEGISVTLDDCAELAADEGEPDAWMLAARYASVMLPGIFKRDDPAAQVRFAPEGRAALEGILTALPAMVFTADDALGWVYQFWQTKAKQEVNASGRKIGGADLPAVTQLFTEDYMVRFLLENSLGAWWAARHPHSPLLSSFTYLRFKDDGTPAAGAFPGWPERAAAVTVMDPCCGSGHFLVAAFAMLRQMRMEEEGLLEADAADAVLRDNVFGLELDARCTQIAAFALALAAWKAGGYRDLPLPNVACSGIPVQGQWETWAKLAGDDSRLTSALQELYRLFTLAPDLGSLIDPTTIAQRDPMFTASYEEVDPLMQAALERERTDDDPTAAVFGTSAVSTLQAAKLLRQKYSMVATNVPYLGQLKQKETLKMFSESLYPNAKADLATVFLCRCRSLTKNGGVYCLVTPQNWLFLESYRRMRSDLLTYQRWLFFARLGNGAFDMISGWVVNIALIMIENNEADSYWNFQGIDASVGRHGQEKASLLISSPLVTVNQHKQLLNRKHLISLSTHIDTASLSQYASVHYGSKPGQTARIIRLFWEVSAVDPSWWVLLESTPRGTTFFSGKSEICLSLDKIKDFGIVEFGVRGSSAWHKIGVILSKMSNLPSSIYCGELFDDNTYVLSPKLTNYLGPIFHFVQSPEYAEEVRRKNQKLAVDTLSMIDVPFDLERWQKVADEAGPLPEPYSNDPTQWLFKGHPVGSTDPLHVAVARLLGYRWPEQSDDDGLNTLVIADGIACLPPMAGEPAAAERLRALLAVAYGADWSHARLQELLDGVGAAGKGLDTWLRDDFFAAHCKLFHQRPFIWHIWDGRKDGFSAIINYHLLDAARLTKLIYSYLGPWIETQRRDDANNVTGAGARLVAALELQKKLQAIQVGEPPYDIYVRWKPLHQQAIGWNPDLNDGVRLNIRPFVTAGVLRSKVSINWNKDRGIDPDGSERHNDRHYTVKEKQAARSNAGAR